MKIKLSITSAYFFRTCGGTLWCFTSLTKQKTNVKNHFVVLFENAKSGERENIDPVKF